MTRSTGERLRIDQPTALDPPVEAVSVWPPPPWEGAASSTPTVTEHPHSPPPKKRERNRALAAGVGLAIILTAPAWIPLLFAAAALFLIGWASAHIIKWLAKGPVKIFNALARLGNWFLDSPK